MYSLKAHEILLKSNISSEIINLRSIKPLDKNAIIKSVKKTGRIIIVEEGWRFCGVGAEIISMLVEEAFDYLDAEPIRITGKNVPLPYAENLEKKSLPQIDEIVQKSKDICYFKGKN